MTMEREGRGPQVPPPTMESPVSGPAVATHRDTFPLPEVREWLPQADLWAGSKLYALQESLCANTSFESWIHTQ